MSARELNIKNTSEIMSVREGNDSPAKDQTEAEPLYLEIENKNKIPLWLAPCHLVAALFQCMQSLFLFAFSSQVDLKWYLYSNLPTNDVDLLGERDVYAKPEPHELVAYSITWYAGVFILLSGIDHIVSVLPRFRQYYEYHVERHQSPIRWIEYGLSAAIMRVHIAQVAGVTDVHTLFLLFVLGHTAMYFPAIHEKMNAKARADGYKQNWYPFYCGCLAHIASWSVIFCFFFSGLDEPPAFVGTIVGTLFMMELCFPLCFVLQWKKIGVFSDYLIGEFGFIMLSFTAKTLLAWVTLAGANGYSRRGG